MINVLVKRRENNTLNIEIFAPFSGLTFPLDGVNDPVFAQKMLGDGVAITPSKETIYSPIDGEITMLDDTRHAIGFKNASGIEVLIHIGLDTVALKGEGFETFVSVGQSVTIGTPLISFDLELLKNRKLDPTTMIVVTNSNEFDTTDKTLNKSVVELKDVIWRIKK